VKLGRESSRQRLMRIYFSPNGLGLGHVSRCLPLAEDLKASGDEILFSTYREGLTFLKKTGFRYVAAPEIAHEVHKDGTIDFRLTTAKPGPFGSIHITLNQLGFEIQAIKEFDPDIVVSDSRATPILAAKLLGLPNITILNQFQVTIPRRRRLLRLAAFADMGVLTVVGRIWALSDKILIPDFPLPYTISWNQKIQPRYRNKIKLVGPILTTHPSQLPSKKELRKRLGIDDRPMIFAAISGPMKEKAYFEGILQQIFKKFPQDYRIVMTLGNPNFGRNIIREGDFATYHWLENRFEYLKACDLFICRGGHGSITQAMIYGKPMIIIPTPNHPEQATNSKRAAALHVAKIMDQEKLDLQITLKTVEEILGERSYLEKAGQIANDMKNMNAVKTIVEEIKEAAEANLPRSG
jgi:UDP-N-acetylglucosamine--N-acetylmuramyl-(pentapeptide) pyrophosphoryl-undecaprenol N-acetylglucosamine transferase